MAKGSGKARQDGVVESKTAGALSRRAAMTAKHAENEAALELAGGTLWVAEQLAAGAHLRDVASRIGVTYWWLYTFMESAPARQRIIAHAHKAGASAKVAEAEKIADELAGRMFLQPADVAAAKLRTELRWRYAARRDPDVFAEKKEANTLNINELHLAAVRAVNASPPQRSLSAGQPSAPANEAEEAEWEVVPGQDSGTVEAQVQAGEEVT